MKLLPANVWVALIACFFVSCTADTSAPAARTVKKAVLTDCEDSSGDNEGEGKKKASLLQPVEKEETDNDSSSAGEDIVINEAEVGIEVIDEDEPCETRSVSGDVEASKIPLVIEIPDAPPLSDERAMEFLAGACLSCHEADKGTLSSFWAMPEGLTKDQLKIDPMAPAVYYSLVVKAKGIQAKPRAMPDRELTEEEAKDLPGLISWFEAEMPTVVASASFKYGQGEGNNVGVALNYRCDNPVTFRKYLQRLTNDAFDRNPTIDEIRKLADGDPDRPVTRTDRNRMANLMFEDEEWRAQFMQIGLRKFANKIGGAGDILAYGDQITDMAAADLQEEFYQYLLKYIEKKTWKEMLLADTVFVTSNTAGLYEGCSAPVSGTWKECDLKGKRGSYFSTVSYLRSKSSSFLTENNNYGRAALMHFIVSGDVFKAAFDETAGEAVKDLPECLESNDWRGRAEENAFAPFGSVAIPSTGNLCQSCHIDRQMAAGSILFRPFNKAGLLYGQDVTLASDEDFATATAENMKVRPDLDELQEAQVDEAYLQSLLEEPSGACMPKRGIAKEAKFENVGDLAAYIIGDGRVLAGGLARHMPRAMSNLLNTTEEIIVRVNNAYFDEETGGMLIPVFKAYFSSETFACEAKEL